jgi:hypothetical protein
MKVVLGDFNSKIGKETMFRPTIGLESLHDESNDHGIRLVNFATSKDLIVKSTYLKHKDIHKQTWVSADRYTFNRIDHVLVNSRRQTNVLDVRSYKGTSHVSDHFLVIGRLRVRLSTKRTRKGKSSFERFDTEKLKTNHWKDRYQVEISNMFEALQTVTENPDEIGVDERWEIIEQTVKDAVKATIDYRKKRKDKPRFDEDCRKSVEKRRECKLTWLQVKDEGSHQVFSDAAKATGRSIRQKKAAYLKGKINEIETNSQRNNVRAMYIGINSHRKGFQARLNVVRNEEGNLVADAQGVLKKWKDHFSKILNVHKGHEQETTANEVHTAEPHVPKPSLAEIVNAIKKLKNNRAPGMD